MHVPGTGYTPLPLESAADQRCLPAAERVLHCQVTSLHGPAIFSVKIAPFVIIQQNTPSSLGSPLEGLQAVLPDLPVF